MKTNYYRYYSNFFNSSVIIILLGLFIFFIIDSLGLIPKANAYPELQNQLNQSFQKPLIEMKFKSLKPINCLFTKNPNLYSDCFTVSFEDGTTTVYAPDRESMNSHIPQLALKNNNVIVYSPIYSHDKYSKVEALEQITSDINIALQGIQEARKKLDLQKNNQQSWK